MTAISQNQPLTFRLYQPSDYEGLKKVMQLSYADLEESYAYEDDVNLLSMLYPRGQIVCLLDGEIVGATISRIVPSKDYSRPHTQAKCINMDLYEIDALNGDSVYGMDVFVNPEFYKLKIASQIVTKLSQHIFEDNFKYYMGTSRLVNYPQYMHEMSIKEYTQKVKNKELRDMALGFHLQSVEGIGFINENPNFSEDDVASAGHGVILGVFNPDFDPLKPIFANRMKHLDQLKWQLLCA